MLVSLLLGSLNFAADDVPVQVDGFTVARQIASREEFLGTVVSHYFGNYNQVEDLEKILEAVKKDDSKTAQELADAWKARGLLSEEQIRSFYGAVVAQESSRGVPDENPDSRPEERKDESKDKGSDPGKGESENKGKGEGEGTGSGPGEGGKGESKDERPEPSAPPAPGKSEEIKGIADLTNLVSTLQRTIELVKKENEALKKALEKKGVSGSTDTSSFHETIKNMGTRLDNFNLGMQQYLLSDDLEDEVSKILENSNLAKKDELDSFAKKDALNSFAKKDALNSFATKDDVKVLASQSGADYIIQTPLKKSLKAALNSVKGDVFNPALKASVEKISAKEGGAQVVRDVLGLHYDQALKALGKAALGNDYNNPENKQERAALIANMRTWNNEGLNKLADSFEQREKVKPEIHANKTKKTKAELQKDLEALQAIQQALIDENTKLAAELSGMTLEDPAENDEYKKEMEARKEAAERLNQPAVSQPSKDSKKGLNAEQLGDLMGPYNNDQEERAAAQAILAKPAPIIDRTDFEAQEARRLVVQAKQEEISKGLEENEKSQAAVKGIIDNHDNLTQHIAGLRQTYRSMRK